MKYQVVVLRQAEEDVQTIFDWLAKRSPAGARSWYKAFEGALDRLEDEAERFSSAPERQFFAEAIRQCLFKTRSGRRYRILLSSRIPRSVCSTCAGQGNSSWCPS